MSFIKKIFLSVFLIGLLLYPMFVVRQAEYDPFVWNDAARDFFCCAWFFVSFMVSVFTTMIHFK
jgi:hypothetical protein